MVLRNIYLVIVTLRSFWYCYDRVASLVLPRFAQKFVFLRVLLVASELDGTLVLRLSVQEFLIEQLIV